jgi:YggT family protein
MAALVFLVDTLLGLCLLVFLLRLLLQWARADFRNPAAQALLQITSPVLIPLRRVVPALGRIDSASVLIVLLLAVLKVAAPLLLRGYWPTPASLWLLEALVQLARTVLWIYFGAIFIYALLSMVAPGSYSPLSPLLAALCEPILRHFRRLIPALGGLDFSPLWAGILIQVLLILLEPSRVLP